MPSLSTNQRGSEVNPGIYTDLDEVTYHADAALSASGAKKLLPPSCPALFQWERENGQQPKAVFDIGKAAHAKVLGAGAEVVVVDADNWMTKSAKEQRTAAYAEGKTPVLRADADRIDGMAAAIRRHPVASALFDPDHGRPEVSGFWHDQTHGVDRRLRVDWMPDTDGGRLVVPDYKTCESADPGAIARAAANFRYHMQHPWYLDGLHALEVAEELAFIFVFQMKAPPYLVTVVELDTEAVHAGRALNDQALQVFAECSATGVWPGFSDDIELISLPGWATRTLEMTA
jgi:hypothetical protein